IKATEALPRLQSILSGDTGEQDESVLSSVRTASQRIETYQDLQQLAGTLFSGISLGSILLLMGLGLAIIFGLMGVINMAHGEMMMIGAYTAFLTQELFSRYLPPSWLDAYFIAALPLSFAVTGMVGLLLEKGMIRFLYGRPLETLLATWGVSLILQQSARWLFGDLTSVNAPSWMRGGFEATAGLVLPYNRIFIILLSLGGLAGIYALLFKSRWGLRVRAVTQNREISACMGISTRRVDGWTFALGAGLAGIAGCALSLIGNVDPEMGRTYIVDSFMVVVVGGVGKLMGTVVSAMGIGMLNKILEPAIGGTGGAIYAKLILLGGIILFLQRKPSGLFPAKGRAADSA
ncbi:MAG TPA: urea ABC transporter permease subunit UrtB, partial [Nitrospiria bacterium]